MPTLFKIFVDILLLQAGPQDIPASRFLFQASLMLYFAAGVLASLSNFPPLSSVGISAVDTTLLALLVWIALRMRHFDNRVLQTLTAVLGALGLLTVISLPLDAWYAMLNPSDQESDQLPALVMLGLLVWSLAVLGHILRHALDIVPAMAAGLSLLYLILSFVLTTFLFIPVAGNG
ncbi:conserved membrane hypothetical protein [Gammaproteobacteria bacterium]